MLLAVLLLVGVQLVALPALAGPVGQSGNVFLGQEVDAHGPVPGGYPETNLVNGSSGDEACINGPTRAWTITLDSIYRINQIAWHITDNEGFGVESSMDGASWTSVFGRPTQGVNSTGSQNVDILAQFIRLSGSTGGWLCFRELSGFGIEEVPATNTPLATPTSALPTVTPGGPTSTPTSTPTVNPDPEPPDGGCGTFHKLLIPASQAEPGDESTISLNDPGCVTVVAWGGSPDAKHSGAYVRHIGSSSPPCCDEGTFFARGVGEPLYLYMFNCVVDGFGRPVDGNCGNLEVFAASQKVMVFWSLADVGDPRTPTPGATPTGTPPTAEPTNTPWLQQICGGPYQPPCHVYWLTPGPVVIRTTGPVPVQVLQPAALQTAQALAGGALDDGKFDGASVTVGELETYEAGGFEFIRMQHYDLGCPFYFEGFGDHLEICIEYMNIEHISMLGQTIPLAVIYVATLGLVVLRWLFQA